MTFRQLDRRPFDRCVRCLREDCFAHQLWLELPHALRNPFGFGACSARHTATFFANRFHREDLIRIADECSTILGRNKS